MDLTQILIQLVSGALGGNAAGAVAKESSLGTLGNTIVGALGGGLGGPDSSRPPSRARYRHGCIRTRYRSHRVWLCDRRR